MTVKEKKEAPPEKEVPFESEEDKTPNPFDDTPEESKSVPDEDPDQYIKKNPKAAERLQKLESEKQEKEEKLKKAEDDNRLMREYFAEQAERQKQSEEKADPKEDLKDPQSFKEKLKETWHKDPVEAMSRLVDFKLQPLAQVYVTDKAETATKEIESNPKFKQYEPQFKSVWQTVPVVNRTQKMAKFIFDNVRVQDLDKREAEFEKKSRSPEDPPYTEKPTATPPEKEVITPKERRMMEAFNMNEDEWRSAAKESRGRVI
jgi:hypothetical protein